MDSAHHFGCGDLISVNMGSGKDKRWRSGKVVFRSISQLTVEMRDGCLVTVPERLVAKCVRKVAIVRAEVA